MHTMASPRRTIYKLAPIVASGWKLGATPYLIQNSTFSHLEGSDNVKIYLQGPETAHSKSEFRLPLEEIAELLSDESVPSHKLQEYFVVRSDEQYFQSLTALQSVSYIYNDLSEAKMSIFQFVEFP